MPDLTSFIDHTLLKPEATTAEIAQFVQEGVELGVYSVCVSPSVLPLALPEGATTRITAVCGFPSGRHASEIKALEAALSVARGADEIDMVIDLGAALDGRFDDVEADIRAVRNAIPGAVLKVIIESAALSDEQIVAVCQAAASAEADFVKTSTGFHPAGGASAHAVALMARTVGPDLEVKASGGIRTADQAKAMIEAGATRLGVSGTRALLAGTSEGSAGY
jgi:deoxyribose-phosphate aldolase